MQSQSAAALSQSRGEEGVEYALEVFRGNSLAVICDYKAHAAIPGNARRQLNGNLAMAAFEALPLPDQKRCLEQFSEILQEPLLSTYAKKGLSSPMIRRTLSGWLVKAGYQQTRDAKTHSELRPRATNFGPVLRQHKRKYKRGSAAIDKSLFLLSAWNGRSYGALVTAYGPPQLLMRIPGNRPNEAVAVYGVRDSVSNCIDAFTVIHGSKQAGVDNDSTVTNYFCR